MEEGAQLILLGQLQKRSVSEMILQFSWFSSLVCQDPTKMGGSVPRAWAHPVDGWLLMILQ